MKILIGHFTSESNEHVPYLGELKNFILGYGDEVQDLMHLRDVFKENDVEAIGSIYANGHTSGPVEKHAFEYILNRLITDVNKYRNDIDGILLLLHGASKIQDLPGSSGEPLILSKIRDIMGPYFPVAIVVDPHGNLNQDYCESATILRSYRESPHTDMYPTHQYVAQLLIDLIKDNRKTNAVYRKLPLILGGERSVSTDEPVRSINQLLDKVEQDERIMSASWHVGYIRHDSQNIGCSIVVVPSSKEYSEYANEVADMLANYVMDKRHEFHFHGNALEPEEALTTALDFAQGRVFITDSGDNTTSGATGANTYILRQFLAASDYQDKKILFATINDPNATRELLKQSEGDKVTFTVGQNIDELSQPVELSGTIKRMGIVHNILGVKRKFGDVVTVAIDGAPIDVMVANVGISFAELHQYEAAQVDPYQYDIVIVKQGYIFPEINAIADMSIMSLTNGTTYQVAEKLPFRLIDRPMFPIDQF
ncbi:M81 family metallopeptidase [Vibrio nitrifigilis]|uniref:M81 family metallopeptidase n=1 Tax=Vibrio nitrifigilis TaxID=2789781 RepID=A0ABS0GMJ7_9VIBR|nr:M81 family metallopeptidase [Vibrio nitrifigilis]MBF9003535.1 M81 family metallopeptidase [Vibrio nitrifigilis]